MYNFHTKETKNNHLIGSLKGVKTQKQNREKLIQKYYKDPRKCLICGKPLPFRKRKYRFCSHNCSATYYNLQRGKREFECCFCGKKFSERGGGGHRKFCSMKCSQEYTKNNTIQKFLQNQKTTKMLTGSILRFLKNKANNKCQKCGWSEINPKTGNVPVQINHKDGNSENNLLENLEVLCPNCHSLTETFGSLNMGHGRAYRRKRYKEGKSY